MSLRPRPARASLAACDAEAKKMHVGVRKSFTGSLSAKFNPENAWHAGECTPGALCLFDDKGYKDRRLTFGGKSGYPADSSATSSKNLKDHGFGDKTSAVWNRSSSAWKLYDDSGFKDRVVCISAGKKVSDLKASAYKFNDKTSSVKRLKSKTC